MDVKQHTPVPIRSFLLSLENAWFELGDGKDKQFFVEPQVNIGVPELDFVIKQNRDIGRTDVANALENMKTALVDKPEGWNEIDTNHDGKIEIRPGANGTMADTELRRYLQQAGGILNVDTEDFLAAAPNGNTSSSSQRRGFASMSQMMRFMRMMFMMMMMSRRF